MQEMLVLEIALRKLKDSSKLTVGETLLFYKLKRELDYIEELDRNK